MPAMTIILLQEGLSNLHRIKIRIEGPDEKGLNTTRAISVLSEHVDVVRDIIEQSFKRANKIGERPR